MGCHVPACLLPALHKVQGGFRVPHRPQVLGVGTAASLPGFPRARHWGNSHPAPRAFPVSTLLPPCHALTKACFLLSLLWPPPHVPAQDTAPLGHRSARSLQEPSPPLVSGAHLQSHFRGDTPLLPLPGAHVLLLHSETLHQLFLLPGKSPLCSSGPFLLRIWGFVQLLPKPALWTPLFADSSGSHWPLVYIRPCANLSIP